MKTWDGRPAHGGAANMEAGRVGMVTAARRALQAARDANDRTTRQALARCAERYILGALGYERMGIEGAARSWAAPDPMRSYPSAPRMYRSAQRANACRVSLSVAARAASNVLRAAKTIWSVLLIPMLAAPPCAVCRPTVVVKHDGLGTAEHGKRPASFVAAAG